MTRKQTVFISHIHEEHGLALLLQNSISETFAGMIGVFVSADQASISPGEDWGETIDTALKEADLEILLCSAASVVRPWIFYEAGAGAVRKIPIIPFCHSGLAPESLPAPLNRREAIRSSDEHQLVKLFATIANKIGFHLRNFDAKPILADIRTYEAMRLADESRRITQSIKATETRDRPEFERYVGDFITYLHQRVRNDNIADVIARTATDDGLTSPMQRRIAAWRIARTNDHIAQIRTRRWEIEALAPQAYVASIFEGIISHLRAGDEYITVTNLRFWSNSAVGKSNFLEGNIVAARLGVRIRRVFVVNDQEWAERLTSPRIRSIFEGHHSADLQTQADGERLLETRILIDRNATGDLTRYSHFGLARRLEDAKENDEGCVVVVPRYMNASESAPISHLALVFSDGPSSDHRTKNFLSIFREAWKLSTPLQTAFESLKGDA